MPVGFGKSRRLSGSSRKRVPAELHLVIAARVATGESLRVLAGEFGTSHETIRRIARGWDAKPTLRSGRP